MSESVFGQFSIERQDFRETPLRYRLQLAGVGLEDVIASGPSGILRIVSYKQDSSRNKHEISMQARGLGLALGRLISGDGSRIQKIEIPISTRPVRYDAKLDKNNNYSDNELFSDAGRLLGLLKKIDPSYSIGEKPPIGQLFSVIDFVSDGEPHLFLTPGFERTLAKVDQGVDSGSSYAARMKKEFGSRFINHQDVFLTHFIRGAK